MPHSKESLPKRERLGLLFSALEAAETAADLQEGWSLVDRELRLIEDQYTSLPYDRPSNYGLAQRMYIPPLTLQDAWSQLDGWNSVDLFAHQLRISETGGIEIIDKKTGKALFSKH